MASKIILFNSAELCFEELLAYSAKSTTIGAREDNMADIRLELLSRVADNGFPRNIFNPAAAIAIYKRAEFLAINDYMTFKSS